MVSRYLDEMEKWAGSRLIHRSTRRLTITPAGEKTLEKTRQLALLSQGIEGGPPALPVRNATRCLCAFYRDAFAGADCPHVSRPLSGVTY